MLNNRILVVGLERRYLESLSQMKSEFIFIHLEDPSKYNSLNHSFECLIFESKFMEEMTDILKDYNSRPLLGIGKGPHVDGITWLIQPPIALDLENILLNALGTLRAPPKNTGQIEPGTVVKNKTFPSWGMGVVKKTIGDDLFLINFPQALKITKKDEHVCHKSAIRIICSIKELTNETHE